jgi:flagellar hook-basal body complex protein FliE
MTLLRPDQVSGQKIDLKKTNPLHMDSIFKKEPAAKGPEESFGDVLMKAFDGVNDSQKQTDMLSTKMITDPDEVSVHDVMISMAESSLALNMAKTIVNRAISAYKEIINSR